MALSCGIDAGIYLGLVKENFLHDSSGFVPSKLAIKTSKAFFLQTGEGGIVLERTLLYIYT